MTRSELNQSFNRWLLFLIPLTFMIITPWQLSETALWTGYGKHLWRDWHFLYKDTASFLATDNNVTSAWLLSFIYYAIYKLGDLFAVAHLHHLVLLLVLGIIYRNTIFKNPWPWSAKERYAIYLVWLGAGSYFSLRPALFAYVPFLLSFLLLDKSAAEKRPLSKREWVSLVGLQILWVNLHASFALLPLMTAWTFFSHKNSWKKFVMGLACLGLSTFVNPFGVAIYGYLIKTKNYAELLGFSEWASVFSLEYPLQTVCFWGLLIAFVLGTAQQMRRGKVLFHSPFLVLVFLPFLGLRLSVFSFCALPIFLAHWAGLYAPRPAKEASANPLGPFLVLSVILAVLVFYSPYLKNSGSKALPVQIRENFDDASIFAISQYIAQSGHSCPVLNDLNVGHFLLLKSSSSLFVDGRLTPYTKESLLKYLAFMQGKNLEIAKETGACFAVLSEERSANVIEKLKQELAFEPLFNENGYLLLRRSP